MILSLSLLQLVILAPIVALVFAWLYIQWAYHRQLALARKLPTAIPAYPLIGHLLQLKTILRVGSQTWKLGLGHPSGLSCLWLGPVPWIMINDAEHIKVVLNNSNCLEKATLYDVLHYVMGNGLLTAPVSTWKISRKHINTMFQSENLQKYMPTFNETSSHLVEDLSEHVGEEEFDCEDYIFLFSLINTLKILFGPVLEIDRKSEELKEMFHYIKLISKQLGERVYNPILISDTIFKLLRKQSGNHVEAFRRHLKVLTKTNQKVHAAIESKGQAEYVKTFSDIFQLLNEKNPIFNGEYMLNELTTIVGTGADTTALTVSSCLIALGAHPDIQKNLYEEIISVVGEDSEVYAEHVSKMTYLDQVLKETLRYFCIAPVGARRCNADVKLDGYTIPKGTTVVISFVGLNYNEEVFPDPLRFDPDRFSPENSAKRHSYSFLPFSGGPRNCIGKNYAMMAMKITLVHLLKSYKIESNMEIQKMMYQFGISMISVDGYNISIKRRV